MGWDEMRIDKKIALVMPRRNRFWGVGESDMGSGEKLSRPHKSKVP